MKRTTILADTSVLLDLKRIGMQENKSLAQVMREALEAHVELKRIRPRRFAFVGKYDSDRDYVAGKHESLLSNRTNGNLLA